MSANEVMSQFDVRVCGLDSCVNQYVPERANERYCSGACREQAYAAARMQKRRSLLPSDELVAAGVIDRANSVGIDDRERLRFVEPPQGSLLTG